MAFYQLPNPYDPHYAIPEYVMAEPPGRGTFTTKWLPRGTIYDLVPDSFAKPILGGGATPGPAAVGYVGEAWFENAIPKVSAVANGILGYKRTGDPVWGFVWGVLGYLQPVLATGVALAAHYAEFDIEGRVKAAWKSRGGKSEAAEMGYAKNPPRRRRRRRARRSR